MTIWSALSKAYTGWMMILRGEPGWRAQFSLTWPGLVTSLAIFLFCAFLAIAAASTYQGMPGLVGVMDALLAQALWIVAVWISVRLNARILKSDISTRAMMIPAIYLLIFYLLAGAIINLIMPLAVLVLTAGLAYPFYRLGRVVADWPVANALIFAVLTVVLLVGIPLTLYILSNPSL
jgi:hypothetical protein